MLLYLCILIFKWSAIIGLIFSVWYWLSPGIPFYRGQAHLGNQHHAEKLSPGFTFTLFISKYKPYFFSDRRRKFNTKIILFSISKNLNKLKCPYSGKRNSALIIHHYFRVCGCWREVWNYYYFFPPKMHCKQRQVKR